MIQLYLRIYFLYFFIDFSMIDYLQPVRMIQRWHFMTQEILKQKSEHYVGTATG